MQVQVSSTTWEWKPAHPGDVCQVLLAFSARGTLPIHDTCRGTRQAHPKAESLQVNWAGFILLARCASMCTCYACMADFRLGYSRGETVP